MNDNKIALINYKKKMVKNNYEKKKCLVNKCNFCKYEKENTLGVR